jgi:two-component system, sensor histidine kinase and response regulator
MILNVDDHEPGRYAKSRLLKQAGYTVAEAASGSQALELAALHRPLLIMLDVNLPDISGLEVCRRIKSHPDLGSTPVLQVSASAITNGDQVGGLDNGADAYLIEPVDPDVLLATVRALLRMRKAEAELEQANRALQVANNLLSRSNDDLQEFAYMASHDLQEPLKTVSSFATLLERRYRGRFDADADDFLTHIQRSASRMSSLIQGLLLYAQAAQGNDEDWAAVNLDEVLAWTLKDLEQSITEGAATITSDPLPTVTGNRLLLSQLFQNLIHNALKYRKPEEPARIHVSASPPVNNMVEISISDNGVGVPEKYQGVIFAPFRRLHGQEVPGSGIGLATCQRIAERHGGRIRVESDGEGKGANFCFSLRAH